MRKYGLILIAVVLLMVATAILVFVPAGTRTSAQTTDDPKMPEIVVLGKDAMLGQVTFNHAKHNDGTYKVDGAPLACTTCHHTAQPAAGLVAPMKTAWPADRTTTLTKEVFTADPKAAGVASCRDCHARKDATPKLLATIPEITAADKTTKLTNQAVFHTKCAGCHTEYKKTNPTSTAPTTMQCTKCHVKAAPAT